MAHLYYNFWRKYSILPLAYRALLAIHSPASNHNACVIPTVRQVSTYMKPHTCCSQIALQRTEIASFRYLLATYRVWPVRETDNSTSNVLAGNPPMLYHHHHHHRTNPVDEIVIVVVDKYVAFYNLLL